MKKYNQKLYPTLFNRGMTRILWTEEWFFEFLCGVVRYGIPKTELNNYKYLKKSDSLVIIANGPSVAIQMDEIAAHRDCDYACMNYYPTHSDQFDILKPIYYFGVDVMLYDKQHPDKGRRIDTVNLRKKLNSIDWKMIAFMYKDQSLLLKNPKVKELRLVNYMIDGVYSKFRGMLFDKNFALPKTRTVATVAILTGIRLGYKTIYVYGIDMSQHEGTIVNCDNKTVNRDIHFYKPVSEKNVYRNDFVGIMEANYFSLRSFRTLEAYANDRGCKIYNCSNHSYVDAFERRSVNAN